MSGIPTVFFCRLAMSFDRLLTVVDTSLSSFCIEDTPWVLVRRMFIFSSGVIFSISGSIVSVPDGLAGFPGIFNSWFLVIIYVDANDLDSDSAR